MGGWFTEWDNWEKWSEVMKEVKHDEMILLEKGFNVNQNILNLRLL